MTARYWGAAWILIASMQVTGQQLSEAERFALNLQRTYTRDGIDVEVTYSATNHELRLISDGFREANLRDSALAALKQDSKTLCEIDIWYAEAGYDKGLLSSDITKRVSFNCPAARNALITETSESREELAKTLDMPEYGVRVKAEGTVLVCRSESLDDAENRKRLVQMLLRNKRDLCERQFSGIRLEGPKQKNTVPISCR